MLAGRSRPTPRLSAAAAFAVSPPFAALIRVAAQKLSFAGLAILISTTHFEHESRAGVIDGDIKRVFVLTDVGPG